MTKDSHWLPSQASEGEPHGIVVPYYTRHKLVLPEPGCRSIREKIFIFSCSIGFSRFKLVSIRFLIPVLRT